MLLIDDNNQSKIFVSKKYKYYCEYGNNRSIQVNILNEFSLKTLKNLMKLL